MRAAIEAFEIDGDGDGDGGDDVALTFAARLARENGWSRRYAERVVVEYKRFVLLAMIAGHSVTPSEQVDQAWHLHLVYTRSYWDRLCGEVLGRALHHGPTKGGAEENAKHRAWYDATLASYERTFGAQPPPDIWSPVDVRFGDDLRALRVSTATSFVVNKRAAAAFAAFVAFAVAVALCLP